MGAVLEPITFDHAPFEVELAALGTLLASKADLSETRDTRPLFEASKHLSAFLGTFAPDIGPATELAFEFPFFGDYGPPRWGTSPQSPCATNALSQAVIEEGAPIDVRPAVRIPAQPEGHD